jgi:hypothetical protein
MKMSPSNPTKPNPDDLLADFTDRVLDGKTAVLASSADAELRGLEETVLRLHQALPQTSLDEKRLQRLQADFKVRARKASVSAKPAWRSQQSRQRLILAFTAIAILAVIFIALPFMTSSNGSTQAAAGLQSGGVILLIAAACIIGLLIWLGRRK